LSEIRATTISNAAGTGPITLTGQYAAKAWVNFNGTGTVAIRESANVGSVTDDGTGLYTVNFSSSLTDANYSVATDGRDGSAAFLSTNFRYNVAPTSSSLAINTGTGVFSDLDYVTVTVTR